MRLASLASVVVLALAAGGASAEDTIENSEFANWSKFKKGTSVTVKTTSTANGFTSEIVSTSTLVEVGADKVVVEYVTVTKFNGMEVKAPAARREIPKTIAVVKDPPKRDPKDPKVTEMETGTETIKIIGLELKTKWTKNKVDAGETKVESKVWMCDDIPGMMVKMESSMTGTVTSTTKVELVEFKKP